MDQAGVGDEVVGEAWVRHAAFLEPRAGEPGPSSLGANPVLALGLESVPSAASALVVTATAT